jgi:NADH-quinone oxidoreductase subunit N
LCKKLLGLKRHSLLSPLYPPKFRLHNFMNSHLLILEFAVIGAGLVLLVLDLWIKPEHRRNLGYGAAAFLSVVLLLSFLWNPAGAQYAFNGSYLLDPLALFFKRLFILAAIFVLVMAVDFSDRMAVGLAEFYSIIMFALAGMMFAASANDFILLFVALELITVSFYVLNSFQRSKVRSLEAGVKYLIMGALSTALTLYGIALVFGTAHSTIFSELQQVAPAYLNQPVFVLGLFMVLIGLSFKIAAFPFQIWAPDVYLGSPTPATAFLAIGSKAAGFVLLMRILYSAAPGFTLEWRSLFIMVTIVTLLYGNLCAIPQRNLKRLLGYSSIGNAGYLLLGITAGNADGSSAVLYYLTGYLFSVIAAFFVISVVSRHAEDEDISSLAGLNQRSPMLAASLTFAMVSLAGIPPLAGFFGKFLLLKSVVERGLATPVYFALIGAAIFGIVVSFYYYLGVVRAIYWSRNVPDLSPIPVPLPVRIALYACMIGMLYLGAMPNRLVNGSKRAVAALKFAPSPAAAQPIAAR